jgi:hypothetical protein
VLTTTVIGIGTGKTAFDFATGRVLPEFNSKDAHRLFNVPKGVFVVSVTLRSQVAGVPTTITAYLAVGASRDVAFLPGQTGGIPRLQIGKDTMSGKKTISLMSTMNRSALELGVGANIGGNNFAFSKSSSIRVGTVGANPLVGGVVLPSAPGEGVGGTGRIVGAASIVQRTSLAGVRLGPIMYARRTVVPIDLVAQFSTEAGKKGFTFGAFNVARLNASSDAYVITLNPAFDAQQVSALIDTARKQGAGVLESVLQQLESGGIIRRSRGQ